MVKRVVTDTSAILTLFVALNIVEQESPDIRIIFYAPSCVKGELEQFGEHTDFLGKKAQEALKHIRIDENPLSQMEIQKEKEKLGISEGISSCDIQALHLSFRKDIAFFTDDLNAHYHFSTYYPKKAIFYGILLVCGFLARERDKKEVFDCIFDRLVPKRWPNISDKSLINLKTAVTKFLELKQAEG